MISVGCELADACCARSAARLSPDTIVVVATSPLVLMVQGFGVKELKNVRKKSPTGKLSKSIPLVASFRKRISSALEIMGDQWGLW